MGMAREKACNVNRHFFLAYKSLKNKLVAIWTVLEVNITSQHALTTSSQPIICMFMHDTLTQMHVICSNIYHVP